MKTHVDRLIFLKFDSRKIPSPLRVFSFVFPLVSIPLPLFVRLLLPVR